MQSDHDHIDLSDVEDIPHSELFRAVEEVVKESNLACVNRQSDPVRPRVTFYSRYGKRILDLIAALPALIITSPVDLLLMICTYFDVGKPIIFRQVRVGRNGKPFRIIKFRNMTNDTDEKGELLPPGERVTKLGRFVRRTSLDELLNFWSVLKGDMSLIGPRPLLLEYQPLYSDRHMMRHAVRPGLECPLIKPGITGDTWTDRFENDIYYVENLSFSLDIKMFFSLVKLVFSRKSTAVRGNAVKGSFLGYEQDGTSIDSTQVPGKYFDEAVRRLETAGSRST